MASIRVHLMRIVNIINVLFRVCLIRSSPQGGGACGQLSRLIRLRSLIAVHTACAAGERGLVMDGGLIAFSH
jgi:hypothetical protein